MAKKLDPMDLKQIITLHLDGFSNREIAKTLSISRNTINLYMNQFIGTGINLKDLMELDEADLRELFSSKSTINNTRYDELMRYFEQLKTETNGVGFTFLYHYNNYSSTVDNPYSCTQFLEHWNRKHQKVRGSMKLELKRKGNCRLDFTSFNLNPFILFHRFRIRTILLV